MSQEMLGCLLWIFQGQIASAQKYILVVNSQDKKLGMGVARRACAAKEAGINIIMDCSKNCQSSVGDDNGRCCQDVAIKRYLSKAALGKALCDQEGSQKFFKQPAQEHP